MPGTSFSSYGPTLRIWRAAVIPLIFTECAGMSFHPAPVVPTKQPLPYSAQVRLVEHGVYAVELAATMIEPRTGRAVSNYAGLGKAVGPVSRGSKKDDEGPISKSVQTALNDVFSKLETDTRLTLL